MISERIFFAIERIMDILNIEKEIKVGYLDSVREWEYLLKELSKVFVYLRDVEERNNKTLHEYHRYYVEINDIAESCDAVVDSVTNNLVGVNYIYNLVRRVRYSYNLLPAPQHNYYINITRNININGQQDIGRINISTDSSHIQPFLRPKSYGHVPNPDFVGFNHEIKTLLTHLKLPNNDTHVVAIVGMGGAGKTTLAKQIYHHPQIMSHFSIKIWVCISQLWDKTSILNSIWRQAIQDLNATEMGYDQVVESLSQLLSSHSYLVILDDIWSVDPWNYISEGLPHNSGSKVVITTRILGVPKCIGSSVIIIEPKPLNDKQSRELLWGKILVRNENISHVLQQLGAEMVKKCKGLPLAITALADIFRMNKSQISWERINKRLAQSILHMEDASTQGVVTEVLGLSYYELPYYLKPCVLYLRVFPEDYVIKSKDLIKMWIAESFIRTEEENQVSTAEVYLDELIQRRIIEVVKTNSNGQVRRFRIHDMIRQMIIDIEQKRGFLKDPLRLVPSITLYDDGQRSHSVLMPEGQCSEHLKRIFDTQTKSQIRSFILLHRLIIKEDNILQQLFEKLRLLRVLILHDVASYGVTEKRSSLPIENWPVDMPEEIGNLIHLRYLKLGGCIQHFESIGNLVNLWTLDLTNIFLGKTVQMNFNLCKMKELRHIYFPKYEYCLETKLKLERLKKLKTLCYVKGGEWLLSEMPVLSADLHELRLFIPNINSKEQVEAVSRTPSITSNNLRTLELIWNEFYYELHDMNVMSKCESLNKLRLQGAIKVGTPILFPPNLIKLEIMNTKLEDREVMNIISNSCPLLKILIFKIDAYNGSELACNANSFLQLEKLTLEYQENLRLWKIETSAMPSLHHLTIEGKEDLDVNPEGWKFISEIPQFTYINHDGYKFTFENKLRKYRKKYDVYDNNYHYRVRI